MGALLGLVGGLGLLLLLSWLTGPPPRPRTPSGPSRLARLLAAAGASGITPAAVVTLSAVLAGTTFVVMVAVSRTPPVALVFAVLAGWAPFGVLAARARRRTRELAEVWPEAVDNLASAVRAGLSLPDALAGLAVRGPEPLREPFERFALDYQVTGRFSESLDRLKDRLADPVGDRVVEGLRVAREVGGGELGRLLRNLSGYLRDDARTRSELEARQSWTVNGARLAVSAPWLVLLMLSFQSEVVQRYSSPAGVLVLGFAAVACVVAYRLMLRLGRLPRERRILA